MEISGRVAPVDSLLLSHTLSQSLPLSFLLFRARAQKFYHLRSVYAPGNQRGARDAVYTENSLTSLKYCHQHEDHCFRASLPAPANRPINHLDSSGNSQLHPLCTSRARSAIPANSLHGEQIVRRYSHLEEYIRDRHQRAAPEIFIILHFTERELSISFIRSYVCLTIAIITIDCFFDN